MSINYVAFEDWHDKHEDSLLLERMLGLKITPHAYATYPLVSHGIWVIKSHDAWPSKPYSGGCYGNICRTPGFAEAQGIRITLWNTNPESKWWIENILNQRQSPWRSLLRVIGTPTIYLAKKNTYLPNTTEKEDPVPTNAPKNVVKYYGVLEFSVEPTMSFRNIMNMMIALRQTRVEPGSISIIHKLHTLKKEQIPDLKFSETLAIAIFTTRSGGKRAVATQMFVSGNGWLGSVRDTSPWHIANGKLAVSDMPFTDLSYYPSDGTWLCEKEYNKYILFLSGIKKEEVKRIFKWNYSGTPLKASASLYEASFEDMLKYMRKKE